MALKLGCKDFLHAGNFCAKNQDLLEFRTSEIAPRREHALNNRVSAEHGQVSRQQLRLSTQGGSLKSTGGQLYSCWRTSASLERWLHLKTPPIPAAATSKPTFLVDVEEESDGSFKFTFGTTDQGPAWDRLVSFIFKGAKRTSSFKRASSACQELLGAANIAHTGPTYYSGSAGTIPRWAMLTEMFRGLSDCTPTDVEFTSGYHPASSATAGVWARPDGVYRLGGGYQRSRSGTRGFSSIPEQTMLAPLFTSGPELKLLEAPKREGVIVLKRQSQADASVINVSESAVNSSRDFIWLPSETNWDASHAVRALRLRRVRIKRLQAPSKDSQTQRRHQKKAAKRSARVVGRRTTSDLRETYVFHRNPVQLLDFVLGQTLMQGKPSNADFLLALRKEYAETLAAFLNQVAVVIAGGGLAMMLYVASRMLCINAMFDNGKLIIVIRGASLLWLSTAIRSFRKVILSLKNDSASLCTKARSRQQVARLKRELKGLSYKTLSVMVLSVVG